LDAGSTKKCVCVLNVCIGMNNLGDFKTASLSWNEYKYRMAAVGQTRHITPKRPFNNRPSTGFIH
jgi:hypothetical protein